MTTTGEPLLPPVLKELLVEVKSVLDDIALEFPNGEFARTNDGAAAQRIHFIETEPQLNYLIALIKRPTTNTAPVPFRLVALLEALRDLDGDERLYTVEVNRWAIPILEQMIIGGTPVDANPLLAEILRPYLWSGYAVLTVPRETAVPGETKWVGAALRRTPQLIGRPLAVSDKIPEYWIIKYWLLEYAVEKSQKLVRTSLADEVYETLLDYARSKPSTSTGALDTNRSERMKKYRNWSAVEASSIPGGQSSVQSWAVEFMLSAESLLPFSSLVAPEILELPQQTITGAVVDQVNLVAQRALAALAGLRATAVVTALALLATLPSMV